MKRLKFLLPMALLAANAVAVAEVQKQDVDAVKNYLETKRNVSLSDKYGEGSLTIGGEVGVEYHRITEKQGSENRVGNGTPFDKNEYKIVPKLWASYKSETTWAMVGFKMKNDMGWDRNKRNGATNSNLNARAGSGSNNNLGLEKAYFGMNICDDDMCRLDVEIGRQKSKDLFDSKIQFDSNFDGVLLKFARNFEGVGKAYLRAGPTLIDNYVSHFGWMGEVGLTDIMDTGFYAKYSMNSITKRGKDVPLSEDSRGNPFLDPTVKADKNAKRWQYRNSQVTLGYRFDPEMIGVPVKAYGAYLINHAAKKHEVSKKKENKAWYIGAIFGDEKLNKEGSWNVDVNYQHVLKQAVCDYDNQGIGHNNADKIPYGNTNFKGAAVKGCYAITDNFHLEVEGKMAKVAKKKVNDNKSLKHRHLSVGAYYRF